MDEDQVYELYDIAWEKLDEFDLVNSIKYFRKAKEVVMSWTPVDSSWIVDINEGLAFALYHRGYYREALELYYDNSEMCDSLESEQKWLCKTIAYSTSAIIYSKMGLDPLAVDYYLKSKAIDKVQFPERADFHFSNHQNIGFIYKNIGNYKKAAEHFKLARLYLDDPEIYRSATEQILLLQLTDLALSIGENRQAKEYMDRFFQLKSESPFSGEGVIFQTEIGMKFHLHFGDTVSALQILEEGLNAIKDWDTFSPYTYCRLYCSAAMVLIGMNETEKADDLLKRCKERLMPVSGIPFTEVEDVDGLLRVMDLFNQSALRKAVSSEQILPSEKIKLLKEVYQKSEELADLLQHHLSSVFIPLTKNRLVRSHMSLFETGLKALYELAQIDDEIKWTKKAILLADRSRAILLTEDLLFRISTEASITQTLDIDREIANKYDSIYLELIELELIELEDKGLANQQSTLLYELAELRLQRERLFREELQNHPFFLNEIMERKKADPLFLEMVLEGGNSLLTHFFGEDYLFLISISNKGGIFVKKPASSDQIESILELRNEIERFPTVLGKREKHQKHLLSLEDLSSELYNLLIGDAEKILTDRLIVIAVDEASVIPLAALKTYCNLEGRYMYLLEKVDILNTYSLNNMELNHSLARHEKGGEMLVFSPDYNNNQVRIAGIPNVFQLSPLMYSREEGEWIAEFLGAKTFFDQDASKENFLSRLSDAGIIHLSGHAFVHDQYPELSFIAFSECGKAGQNGHLLTLAEIEKLQTRAQLVFLNGCWTGYGPVLKGEGPESIQRAFTTAGARSLITTLWPVNDHAALELTRSFYKKLISGNTIPESLRKAQLGLLNSDHPVYSHPYYWSGYLAYGKGDNPLKLRKWNPGFLLILTALLVIGFYLLKKP